MANLSARGLEEDILAAWKDKAKLGAASANGVALRLPREFQEGIQPFSEVAPASWKP